MNRILQVTLHRQLATSVLLYSNDQLQYNYTYIYQSLYVYIIFLTFMPKVLIKPLCTYKDVVLQISQKYTMSILFYNNPIGYMALNLKTQRHCSHYVLLLFYMVGYSITFGFGLLLSSQYLLLLLAGCFFVVIPSYLLAE